MAVYNARKFHIVIDPVKEQSIALYSAMASWITHHYSIRIITRYIFYITFIESIMSNEAVVKMGRWQFKIEEY
jgi:hypothetical protein